jgi:hypothetical protein
MSYFRRSLCLAAALLTLPAPPVAAEEAPKVITLSSAEFRPNPLVVDEVWPVRGPTVPTYKLGAEGCRLSGNTTQQPTLLLDVKAPLDSLEASVLSDDEELALGFLLFAPDKSYHCGLGKGERLKLSPGRYAMHIVNERGGDTTGRTYYLALRDIKRPRAFADGVRTVSVPAAIETPLAVEGTLASARVMQDRSCRGGALFASAPDVLLKLTRPLPRLELALAWAPEGQRLRVYGPLETRGPSHVPECPPNDRWTQAMAEGTYALWIDAPKPRPGEAAAAWRIFATTPETKRDLLDRATEPGPQLTARQRLLFNHYPGIDGEKVRAQTRAGDELRRRLFLEAPAPLFVFAKVDTDASLLREENTRKLTLPRAGEPLLVVDVNSSEHLRVLTADGERFWLDPRAVTTQPPGPVYVPTEPRSTAVHPEDALALAHPDEHKKLAGHRALEKKLYDCYGEVWRKHDKTGRAYKYDLVTYRNGQVVMTENWGDKIDRMARAQCKAAQVEESLARLARELTSTRTQRRKAELSEIGANLKKRFPSG